MCKKDITSKIFVVTIVLNVVLSIVKAIAGIIGNSSAVISDSIHSLSDVLSTIVAMIGIKIATKNSDETHQYGHEKFECIASILLSFILFITGIGIAIKGIGDFIKADNTEPTYIALIVAILSIIIKELMYRYTIHYGNKINSIALKADACHHRSDALSSVGVVIGIITSKIGFTYGDTLASLVISIIISIEAIKIFNESIDKLVDKACDKLVVANIESIINKVEGVINIDRLLTRQFGSKIYIDVDIAVDRDLKLEKAHDIAEEVHRIVEHEVIECKHIMVHVNPYYK